MENSTIEKDIISDVFDSSRFLNEGSFGEVRTYINKPEYVIKKIKDIRTVNSEIEFGFEGILNELDIGYNFIHPSLCNFTDIMIEKNDIYIIMPKYTLLKRNYDMIVTDKLRLMYQILHGLKFLHDHNYIHGDLRPDNILLSEDLKTVKICDFGLSHIVGSRQNIELGPELYQPPEYKRNEEEWHKLPLQDQLKLDIWSFGCLMYYFFHNTYIPDIYLYESFIEYKDRLYPFLSSISNNDLELNILKGCLNPIVSERLTVSQLIDLFPDEYKSLIIINDENCYIKNIPGENPPEKWLIELEKLFKLYRTEEKQREHSRKILRRIYAIDKYKEDKSLRVFYYAYMISEEYFNDRTDLWFTILNSVTPPEYYQLLIDLKYNFH